MYNIIFQFLCTLTACSPPKVWFPSITTQLIAFTHTPLPSFPSNNLNSVLCIYTFVSFGLVLFIYFVFWLFLIFHLWVKSYSICLFPSISLHMIPSRSIHVHVRSIAKPCLTLLWAPWTVDRQAPLSMGFSRQEYWSGLPFPPPGDIPDPGIERVSLVFSALAGRFFTTAPPRKPLRSIRVVENGQISSFLWPSSILVCVCVCVCVYVYHIFFT